MFSEHFCSEMITRNQIVLKFLNIYIVEYMDVMLNMVNCYDVSAKPIFQ